ncbi:hypothetical protein MMC10_003117 [Thelotrema lepadinum]|nr:hypothetical protein [Thelotrema lepadinum]
MLAERQKKQDFWTNQMREGKRLSMYSGLVKEDKLETEYPIISHMDDEEYLTRRSLCGSSCKLKSNEHLDTVCAKDDQEFSDDELSFSLIQAPALCFSDDCLQASSRALAPRTRGRSVLTQGKEHDTLNQPLLLKRATRPSRLTNSDPNCEIVSRAKKLKQTCDLYACRDHPLTRCTLAIERGTCSDFETLKLAQTVGVCGGCRCQRKRHPQVGPARKQTRDKGKTTKDQAAGNRLPWAEKSNPMADPMAEPSRKNQQKRQRSKGLDQGELERWVSVGYESGARPLSKLKIERAPSKGPRVKSPTF